MNSVSPSSSESSGPQLFQSSFGRDAQRYISLRLRSMEIAKSSEGSQSLLKLGSILDVYFTAGIEQLIQDKLIIINQQEIPPQVQQ